MTREQLEEVGGIAIGPPSDDIALAIADALLPAPLPPALRAFLSICDGAQAGEVEVFDTERIIAARTPVGTRGNCRPTPWSSGQQEPVAR